MKFRPKLQIIFAFFIIQMLFSCDSSNQEVGGIKYDESKSELGKSLPWFKDSGRSTSTDLIELSLVNEKIDKALNLRIPKAYLTDTKNWKGSEQKTITIETGLPELEPRPASFWITDKPGTPEHDIAVEKFQNGLFIYLEAYRRDEQKYSLVRIANHWKEVYEKNYERQKDERYDLYFYKDINCSGLKKFSEEHLKDFMESRADAVIKDNQVCYSRSHEYFITPDDYAEVWVRYRCNQVKPSNKTEDQGGCTAYTEYRNWAVRYIFKRNQLHRWKEFDTATRMLLDKFYTEG